jgi:hypothetical protein
MEIAIQGTVKELASHGLRVNGKPVTQQMLSVLIRLGACEEVGEEEKQPGQKGPAAKVYRFGGKKTFNFSIDNKPKVKEEAQQAQTPAETPTESPIHAMLPAALQSMTENDVKAMIVGLQTLQTMIHAPIAKQ